MASYLVPIADIGENSVKVFNKKIIAASYTLAEQKIMNYIIEKYNLDDLEASDNYVHFTRQLASEYDIHLGAITDCETL